MFQGDAGRRVQRVDRRAPRARHLFAVASGWMHGVARPVSRTRPTSGLHCSPMSDRLPPGLYERLVSLALGHKLAELDPARYSASVGPPDASERPRLLARYLRERAQEGRKPDPGLHLPRARRLREPFRGPADRHRLALADPDAGRPVPAGQGCGGLGARETARALGGSRRGSSEPRLERSRGSGDLSIGLAAD
jgi:hypothetical protein